MYYYVMSRGHYNQNKTLSTPDNNNPIYTTQHNRVSTRSVSVQILMAGNTVPVQTPNPTL